MKSIIMGSYLKFYGGKFKILYKSIDLQKKMKIIFKNQRKTFINKNLVKKSILLDLDLVNNPILLYFLVELNHI